MPRLPARPQPGAPQEPGQDAARPRPRGRRAGPRVGARVPPRPAGAAQARRRPARRRPRVRLPELAEAARAPGGGRALHALAAQGAEERRRGGRVPAPGLPDVLERRPGALGGGAGDADARARAHVAAHRGRGRRPRGRRARAARRASGWRRRAGAAGTRPGGPHRWEPLLYLAYSRATGRRGARRRAAAARPRRRPERRASCGTACRRPSPR